MSIFLKIERIKNSSKQIIVSWNGVSISAIQKDNKRIYPSGSWKPLSALLDRKDLSKNSV